MIKPTSTNCLLEYIDEPNTTQSGLELLDGSTNGSKVRLNYKAKVLAIGPDVTNIKIDDIVIFKWHNNQDTDLGTDLGTDLEGKKCTFIDIEKVLCILTNN